MGPRSRSRTAAGTDRHLPIGEGWEVAGAGGLVRLGGSAPGSRGRGRSSTRDRRCCPRRSHVIWATPPALDGTLEGFDASASAAARPRRSVPPERRALSAARRSSRPPRYVNWDRTRSISRSRSPRPKWSSSPARCRAAAARQRAGRPPLRRRPGLRPDRRRGSRHGFLIVPGSGRRRSGSARIDGGGETATVERWMAQPTVGYAMTVAVACPGWSPPAPGRHRLRPARQRDAPDRMRRAGQLVWSGGGGMGLPARRPPRPDHASACWSCADGPVAGFTSTGSKRPDVALRRPDAAGFAVADDPRSPGCRVRDAPDGRDYLDFVMALGAVALGYGHPAVTPAADRRRAATAPSARWRPWRRKQLAADLAALMPWVEEVRFLKTGAEGGGGRGPPGARGHRARPRARLRLSRLARLVQRRRRRARGRPARSSPSSRSTTSRATRRADPRRR